MNKTNILQTCLLTFVFVVYHAEVTADEFTNVPFSYAKGATLFKYHCSSCHGTKMDGSKLGPPLMHPYYKPSHHDDNAFYRAAAKGVRAHHWKFGDMPAITTVTRKDMNAIVPFIRWFQKQNGLFK